MFVKCKEFTKLELCDDLLFYCEYKLSKGEEALEKLNAPLIYDIFGFITY